MPTKTTEDWATERKQWGKDNITNPEALAMYNLYVDVRVFRRNKDYSFTDLQEKMEYDILGLAADIIHRDVLAMDWDVV